MRRRSSAFRKSDAPRLAVSDHAIVAKGGETMALRKADAPRVLSDERITLVKADTLPSLGTYLLTEAAQRFLTEAGDPILL